MSQSPSFAYHAQTAEGLPLIGTIQAQDGEQARQLLAATGLRLIDLSPADAPSPRTAALRGDDLVIFNQHLAQLTAAGMPVEQSLRALAQDMRRGKLKRAIQSVADDLDQGQSLAQAFDARRGQFPKLYAQLVDAGIAANNLPGMLMSLGRHYELVHRLRATLAQSLAYPVMVFVAFLACILFMGLFVFPNYEAFIQEISKVAYEFGGQSSQSLPWLTRTVMTTASYATWLAIGVSGLIILAALGWLIARMLRLETWLAQHVASRIPIVGSLLRHSAIARWCNAMQLGVEAGLPLPQAVDLAGQSIGWQKLAIDGQVLAQAITLGQTNAPHMTSRRWLLPASVRATIFHAHDRQNLAQAFASLSNMQQQQAVNRLATLQATLTPILVVILGAMVFITLLAIMQPFSALLRLMA